MKGGQYPDPHEERSSEMLKAELAALKQKIFVTPRAGEKSILRQIRDIEFELTRRVQNGDSR